MSSFDYTDNFNGFNDLINRADFLTEMKIGKAHPSFKGLAGRIKDDPRSGGKGFPRDARMLIKTVLYNVDIFNDEDLATLRASGVEASKEYREALEALFDKYEDEIKNKASDIADELEDQFESFVNDQALMVGAERKEMYLAKREAKAAADKLEKEIEGGGDIVDAVEDAVDDVEQVMSQGTKEAFQSLAMAKADPTHMIVIKVEDESKAEEVKQLISKYADTDHLDIFDNVVQFSSTSDSPLVGAVEEHGIEKVEAALQRDVSRLTNNTVEILPPESSYRSEEDYERMDDEEMGYGLDEPGGVPGSYAMGEEGGGITEVEDAEDLSAKKARAGKDIGKPGKNFSKIAKSAGKKYGSKAAGERVAGAVLAKMRGNYEGAEEFDDFDIGPQSDENVPDDYEEVLDALVDDDKKKHAMKKLKGDDDDPGHIDDMRAEYPPDPFGGGYEDEESIVMQPMLESHKTNTSAYLTEQAASDKRNKKTKVKNQSFKERYKPKTYWQLEELRRYGL